MPYSARVSLQLVMDVPAGPFRFGLCLYGPFTGSHAAGISRCFVRPHLGVRHLLPLPPFPFSGQPVDHEPHAGQILHEHNFI